MSNRSVFEFNHDFSGEIAKNEERFVSDLLNYLRSGFAENAEVLERRYGLRWYGIRHHSDPWEDHIEAQGASAPIDARKAGEIIKKMRTERGLSREELCLKTGGSATNLGRLENGYKSSITPDMGRLIANASRELGFSIPYRTEGED